MHLNLQPFFFYLKTQPTLKGGEKGMKRQGRKGKGRSNWSISKSKSTQLAGVIMNLSFFSLMKTFYSDCTLFGVFYYFYFHLILFLT